MADELLIRLGLDSSKYTAGMKKAAQSTGLISKSAQSGAKHQEQLAGQMKNTVMKLGALAAGAVGVRAALNFGKDAIASYSTLEESINAVTVQFGRGADTILEFGEGAAETVGLANSAFNQLSTTTGAVLSSFISDEQAAAAVFHEILTKYPPVAIVPSTAGDGTVED